MKRSDLFREYARVIDMCEGTGVLAYQCIKNSGEVLDSVPIFLDSPTVYTFAVGICEGKPIFAGDVLYSPYGTKSVAGKNDAGIDLTGYTLTKPDPYAELKAAQKAGKVIQILVNNYYWEDVIERNKESVFGIVKVENLRIKPDPVIVEAARCVYGIEPRDRQYHSIMCTWTDGVLTNVEILK